MYHCLDFPLHQFHLTTYSESLYDVTGELCTRVDRAEG